MRKIRLVALLCAVLTAMGGWCPSAMAAEEAPSLIVEARQVTEGGDSGVEGEAPANLTDILEVSLRVCASQDVRSAQAVLQYNPEVLRLIAWDSGKTQVQVNTGNSWSAATAARTKGPDVASGKPSLVVQMEESGPRKNYLYLAGESLTGELPAEPPVLTPETVQTVQTLATVRFRILQKTEVNAATLSQYLQVAADDHNSPAGYPATLSLKDNSVFVYPATTEAQSVGFTPLAQPELRYVQGPSGYDSSGGSDTIGGGSAEDFSTLVLHDWDNTPLGSLIVPKGEDATELLNEFVQLNSATEEQLNGELWYDDASLPFTYKKGYSFENVWIPYESETLTHYGEGLDESGQRENLPEPEKVDFSNVTADTVMVKAAYRSNQDLILSGATNYQATVMGYNRLGASNNFVIKVLVERGYAPRVGKLSMRTIMTTVKNAGGAQLYGILGLENKDSVIVELIPNKSIDTVKYSVVNTYDVSNWATAGVRSSNSDEAVGTAGSKSGVLYEGTLVAINEALAPGGDSSVIAPVVLTDIGLRFTPTALTYLQNAWRSKNPDYESPDAKWVGLTYAEMEYALNNKGALLPK